MKTIKIQNKKVFDVGSLTEALKAAGFKVSGVSCLQSTPPVVFVYLEDSEKKDPSSFVMKWKDSPRLKVFSNKPSGIDGISEAKSDGVDSHTLKIELVDAFTQNPVSGVLKVQVTSNQLIQIKPTKLEIYDSGMSIVGPSTLVGDLVIKIIDVSNASNFCSLTIRFS